MKLVTGEEMKLIDTVTIEKLGIPALVLMERAGESVANRMRALFERKRVVVISGSGNNGGDGIVVARILRNSDWDVRVLVVSKKSRLSHDCLTQYRIAMKMGMPIEFREKIKGTDLRNSIIVDAVFGTGLNRPVRGPLLDVLHMVNRSRSPVVSVDIPSGISSDTGQIMGKAIKSDYTVTFGLAKIGHYIYPGAEYRGELFVEDIGFPEDLTSSDRLQCNLTGHDIVRKCIKRRSPDSHKGTYGHVFVIAGSAGRTGAALLASRAAIRSGAGAVTLGVPDNLFGIFQTNVLEEMTIALPSSNEGTVSLSASSKAIDFMNDRASVVLLGPGIGVSHDVKKFIYEIILNSEKPLVIDADGLNNIAGKPDILKKAKVDITVTPHPGEMKRLLGGPVRAVKTEEINARRLEIAKVFAEKYRVVCVLKGAPTIIASPAGELFINPTGNPGMATAGSGDVLSGVISSFIAQGFGMIGSAVSGVYMHGMAGDIAREDKGEHALIAGDIIESLPRAFKAVANKRRTL